MSEEHDFSAEARGYPPDDIPPGLPPDFHEDWKALTCNPPLGATKLRHRAALEALAAANVGNHKGTEDIALLVSQFKEATEKWFETLARRDKLLQEVSEPGAAVIEPGLYRRIMAELEGTK